MTAKIDDLEAVRILAETLQPFASDDRERIIRWAREKLGMTTSAVNALASRVETTSDAPRDAVVTGNQGAVDIKKFVTEKAPKSDVHFAATVAYFYQFKSPEKSAQGLNHQGRPCGSVPTGRQEATEGTGTSACKRLSRWAL